jgi:hypothetical protein
MNQAKRTKLARMWLDVCHAYLKLQNLQQRTFEYFILEHAFLGTHMDAYRKSTPSANKLRRQLLIELRQSTSADMAAKWFALGIQLAKRKRPVNVPDSRILELVRDLLFARFGQQQLRIGGGITAGCYSGSISLEPNCPGGPDLYRLYLCSDDHQRRAIEDAVTGQAFLSRFFTEIGLGGQMLLESRWAYEQLHEQMGWRAAEAWKDWVTEVAEEYSDATMRHNALLNMLKNLIVVRCNEKWVSSQLEICRQPVGGDRGRHFTDGTVAAIAPSPRLPQVN